MTSPTPRLRMFAGPNGSGKSTLKQVLPPELLGICLNPDELEQEICARGFLDLKAYGVTWGSDGRSLDLLMDAIRHTHRAYIFDNSTHEQERTWLAEVTDGKVLEMKTDQMPAWFKRAVWDKIGSGNNVL